MEKEEIEEDRTRKRQVRGPYFSDGAVYTGEWYEFYRDGQGVMEWSNGAKYEGTWKKNKRHGRGRFDHQSGDIYEGIF